MKNLRALIDRRFVSRRQFLIGGGTSLLLPPLLSLLPENVAAAVVARKTVRAVIYCGGLGIDDYQLYPAARQASELAFPGAYSTFYKPLSSYVGQISPMIDASFAPMYSKMNLLRGLSLTGGMYSGHNASVLSGTHSGLRVPTYGTSIDVILEKSPSVYPSGSNVAKKAIRLGDAASPMSFDRVNGKRIVSSLLMGDMALFNSVFAGLPTSTTSGATPANTANKLLVDQVYADLQTLQNHPRISKADKNILDSYIAGMFDLQTKVNSNLAGTQAVCTPPNLSLQVKGTGNVYNFPEDAKYGINSTSLMFDNYIQMIKMAFLCNLTNVVYISNSIWSDMAIDTASQGGLHHECASSLTAATRQAWGLKKMLKLATVLDAAADPYSAGTLLDNSTILFTNELGAWTTTHNTLCIPAVTFGRGGGLIKTGNYVDYTQRSAAAILPGTSGQPGRPYKQLLQTIMQSMGVAKSEYMAFGDGNGFGEFKPGINQFGHSLPNAFSPYASEHNDLLPVVS